MNFANITKDNVNFFAIKNYYNPHCYTEKEFNEDMNRFKYIKRLLKKYKQTGEIKTRLLLNHIIILNNVFGPEAASTLLLFKIESEYWSELKSILQFLNIINKTELENIEINSDLNQKLEEI